MEHARLPGSALSVTLKKAIACRKFAKADGHCTEYFVAKVPLTCAKLMRIFMISVP